MLPMSNQSNNGRILQIYENKGDDDNILTLEFEDGAIFRAEYDRFNNSCNVKITEDNNSNNVVYDENFEHTTLLDVINSIEEITSNMNTEVEREM